MTKIATLKKRLMHDPRFEQEYAKADADYAIVEALIRRSRNALKWRRGVVKRAKHAFSRRIRRLNKLGVENNDVSEMTLISPDPDVR